MVDPLYPHSLDRMYSLSAPTGLNTQRILAGVSESWYAGPWVWTSPKVGSSIHWMVPRSFQCSLADTSLEFHTGWERIPAALHALSTSSFVLSAAHLSSSG